MPDKQEEIIAKLESFAFVLELLHIPHVSTELAERVALALGRCADSIRGIAKDL